MDYELELTKANRLLLGRAFQNVQHVDYSIDCALEGQMGRAFVDDLEHPRSFRITTGPFWYFGGEATGEGGCALMELFPPGALLMPSSYGWLELAGSLFSLEPFTRCSFSTEQLSEERLQDLLVRSLHKDHVVPIDRELAARLVLDPESGFEIDAFDSPEDFVERGLGYAALDGGAVAGVAYSALVCSQGIEVSIFVKERFRQRGLATALGSRLILECLRQGRRPNWDAANSESSRLAKKLGFVFTEAYDAYYRLPTSSQAA